jgi:hypothetical protein
MKISTLTIVAFCIGAFLYINDDFLEVMYAARYGIFLDSDVWTLAKAWWLVGLLATATLYILHSKTKAAVLAVGVFSTFIIVNDYKNEITCSYAEFASKYKQGELFVCTEEDSLFADEITISNNSYFLNDVGILMGYSNITDEFNSQPKGSQWQLISFRDCKIIDHSKTQLLSL